MLRFLQWLTTQEWLLRLLGPLLGPINPFLERHRVDPHATWRPLRERTPLFYSRVFAAHVATRYEDALQILRSPSFTTDRSSTAIMKFVNRITREEEDLGGLIQRNLLMLDGAEHRRLRGLVSKAFTPRRIEQLRPRIQSRADALLDEAAESEDFELMRDFATPLPVDVIAELLGVPTADRDLFRTCSAELAQLLDPLQGRGGAAPMREACTTIYDYFRPLLAERRREPRDDLLSAMISVEESGEMLSERDLLALSTLLLVAGHETTSNLIGLAVLALLDHPDERKRLADDPELIHTAVDEFLRYDGPIQLTDRCALEDTEVAGQRIRKGQLVAVSLASANRDPARFSDPDRLDLGRTDNPHLAFSQGNHFCLGAQLARLETEIAIASLMRRFPDFEGPTQPIRFRRSVILRGPESVHLRLC